jgi:UDP-galactopyranose mutase
MARFARGRRVIFWEEPVPGSLPTCPRLDARTCPDSGVIVVTPVLPDGAAGAERDAMLALLLDGLLAGYGQDVIRWYDTPAALSFSRHLEAICTVYDCTDELNETGYAGSQLTLLEDELMGVADVVFTGGFGLWEAKRGRHHNIHAFPSSVDRAHFAKARLAGAEPADQAVIPGPRLGFLGVIDEQMDLGLLAALADARPHWSLVLVGPVLRLKPADLPKRANLHYLGPKAHEELPRYLGGWDVALAPFVVDDTTRLLSPTQTLEYLAAGRPVVSTPIAEVVSHYGALEAVAVAATLQEFVAACERALDLARSKTSWLRRVDAVLSTMSWDETFARMNAEVCRAGGLGRYAMAAEPQEPIAESPKGPASLRKPLAHLLH